MVVSEPGVGVRGRRVLVGLAGGLLALVALVALGSLAEHAAYAGRILPGVHLDGTPVAGKKTAIARDEIAQLANTLEQEPIRARAGNQTFVVDPSLIGLTVDVDATAQRVKDAGREGNPFAVMTDSVLRRFRSDNVPLDVTYDESRFQGLLDGWSTALDKGLVQGGLKFQGTKVTTISPHAGTGLQRSRAEQELRAALRRGHRTDLTLPVGVVQPDVDQAAVDAAAVQARSLLARSRVVVAGLTPITITPAQLATALTTDTQNHALVLAIDNARLLRALGPALASVTRPPVDATWAISTTNKVSVVPSRDGHELDMHALATQILRGDTTIVARFMQVHPAHDTAWATKLGITEQVSSFTTYHPAGQPRVHNIHLAADILNNTVVEPGQVFSLNQKLGPRTPQKGYVKAPILVEDGFGEDYGGGISQLTTTLYNAVFFGGYEDTEHSPHHFYISRYPMGREATINYPSVDLKFKNDTTHGVLIRTSYTATSITVTFYGDNDGRTVREENRKILHTEPTTDEVIPCSVATPDDDPNHICAQLRPGERSTVQPGETGYDVEFDRVIDQPGKPERRMHYHVHYPMLPNKILVGGSGAPSTSTTVTGGGPTSASAATTASSTTTPAPNPAAAAPKTTQRHG